MAKKVETINKDVMSAEYILASAMEQDDELDAVIIIGITKDQTPHLTFSNMSFERMCFLKSFLAWHIDCQMNEMFALE